MKDNGKKRTMGTEESSRIIISWKYVYDLYRAGQ